MMKGSCIIWLAAAFSSFVMEGRVEAALCGGRVDLTKSARYYVFPPRHPYPVGTLCTWTIVVPNGFEAAVEINRYNHEYYGQSCLTATDNGNQIWKTCSDRQKPQVTWSNQLGLKFKDRRNYGDAAPALYAKFTKVSGCGGKVDLSTDAAVTVRSPLYPKTFPNNAECVWQAEAPKGYHVQMKFGHVRIWGIGCNNGRIAVRDGDENSKPIMNNCFNEQLNIESTGSKLWFRFKAGSTFPTKAALSFEVMFQRHSKGLSAP